MKNKKNLITYSAIFVLVTKATITPMESTDTEEKKQSWSPKKIYRDLVEQGEEKLRQADDTILRLVEYRLEHYPYETNELTNAIDSLFKTYLRRAPEKPLPTQATTSTKKKRRRSAKKGGWSKDGDHETVFLTKKFSHVTLPSGNLCYKNI